MYPKSAPMYKKFGFLKKDVEQIGATPKCNGCQRTGNTWTCNAAHSKRCRDRIMAKMLEEGDPQGRVAKAIERKMRRPTQAQQEKKECKGEKARHTLTHGS